MSAFADCILWRTKQRVRTVCSACPQKKKWARRLAGRAPCRFAGDGVGYNDVSSHCKSASLTVPTTFWRDAALGLRCNSVRREVAASSHADGGTVDDVPGPRDWARVRWRSTRWKHVAGRQEGGRDARLCIAGWPHRREEGTTVA